MTLFFCGLAVGVALSIGVLLLLVAWDRRWHPECSECCLPLPFGYAHKLCPRCQELAAMAEGRQP